MSCAFASPADRIWEKNVLKSFLWNFKFILFCIHIRAISRNCSDKILCDCRNRRKEIEKDWDRRGNESTNNILFTCLPATSTWLFYWLHELRIAKCLVYANAKSTAISFKTRSTRNDCFIATATTATDKKFRNFSEVIPNSLRRLGNSSAYIN